MYFAYPAKSMETIMIAEAGMSKVMASRVSMPRLVRMRPEKLCFIQYLMHVGHDK